MMTQILLVRHGEVAGNAGDKLAFVGWGDLALNERGEKQSETVGEYLDSENIAAVYSSDLQRARITAERIAKRHALDVQIDRDLREVNYGAWENLSEEELLRDWREQWTARQNDPWNVAPPEGESYAQMWARFLPKWQRIVTSHVGEKVVFVGHNGLIRMLLCYVLGAPFTNFKRIHVSNCGVSRLEIDGEKVLVRSINEVTHLQHL